MNPHTIVEERGYFAGIQAWAGDVVGAFGSCQRGCYDRHNDAIAHATVFYRGDRFDDGKHGDGKLDGDIRRGDFQAVADNKHGNAAGIDQWAAGWLLGRHQYDGYGDNRGWYEKGAVGAVYNNADLISAGLGVLAVVAYASCPLTASAGCALGAGLSAGSAIAGAVNVHRSCRDGFDGGCAVAVAASVVSASAAQGSISATSRVAAARSSRVLNTYSEVRYAERTAQVFGATSNALSTGFGYGADLVVGG